MAAVRDPAFWKRFSVAVHLDEEKGTISDATSTSTGSSGNQLKKEQGWLERTHKKSRRTRIIGWSIALGFCVVIAAVVMVFLWYSKVGPFKQ